MAQVVSEIPPRKQDAIHRAVLCGLLGNVGARQQDGEYSGIRGKRFHLFPGSALFRSRPPWVMAAELLETTKVYARTIAAIHPTWIERTAAHLVKREHFDPHWRADIGRVLAFERVTLHGLILIPRRKVHFGPIDPTLSREIFIHHALVLGEYEQEAEFLRHNSRLIKEVQAIEAKARRRDILVDPKARYAFYDARVPRRIYTAQEFEKWRRQAEKRNPRLLFMSRHDLMLHPALGVSEELYPDSITADGTTYPLEYRFEPGDRADGITVTVPLASINQLDNEGFQWLVPGYRAELFASLFRTLPKSIRVKLVPVPDYAAAAAAQLKPSDGPMLTALAHHLGKVSGEPIRADDFQPNLLAEYLRMNFRVVDAADKQVVMGRDLDEIRRVTAKRARASFLASPPPEFHRDQITRWDFGDLPQRVEVAIQGSTLQGFPALVDAGQSVSLRLLDSAEAAEEAMHEGLRRLFMLQLRQEFDYVQRTLPDIERLCLYYATIGRCDDLKEDLTIAIADRAFFDEDLSPHIRSRDEFAARAEAGWRRLSAAAAQVTDLVSRVLHSYHELDVALAGDFPPMWADSIHDMRDQLSHLIYGGFVVRTRFESLSQVPRYLQGIDVRLARLGNAGLTRDLHAMAEVRPLWEQYKARAAEHRPRGLRDPALEQFRWMLEELRISLFAQELKTAVSVSVQRLLRHWELVRE